MFTWICPKCGGEVPPSMNECPRCSPATTAAAPEQLAPTPPPPPSTAPVSQVYTPPPPAAAAPPPVYAPPERRGISPALVAILATVGIAGLLAVLFLYVIPKRANTEESPATKAAAQTTPAQSAHPLAKHLEVVGVRIVEPGSGSAKIQFLVVNHSAADLPEMKMDVTLRAADKDFFTFPVNLPSIGPYESKEMNATVKTELKPYELPDWQTIRPQFVLTSEP